MCKLELNHRYKKIVVGYSLQCSGRDVRASLIDEDNLIILIELSYFVTCDYMEAVRLSIQDCLKATKFLELG